MSTSAIAEGRAEQKAWQDEGQECKVKVTHRGGKSQDQEKGIDRVGVEGETLDMVETRTQCRARAKGTLEGRANIG